MFIFESTKRNNTMKNFDNHITPAEIRVQIAKLKEIAIAVSGDDKSYFAVMDAIEVLKELLKR